MRFLALFLEIAQGGESDARLRFIGVYNSFLSQTMTAVVENIF